MTQARTPQAQPVVRPRVGRLTAFGCSVVVTLTAILGGLGVLPDGGGPSYAATRGTSSDQSPDRSSDPAPGQMALAGAAASSGTDPRDLRGPGPVDADDLALPADSGEGRRVVFDMSAQRVWLVRADESVARTYLVSGSVYDNLDPGSFEVYSRSEDAQGIDGSTMRYMVRFAHGDNAAIGFHDIPLIDGRRVQTKAELGTPLSHGCVRQWPVDARALWRFAPVGTPVVVTA